MDFRFGQFLRCGLLALSVPLVGCWQSGYLSGIAQAADEGMFFMPMAAQKPTLHSETPPQPMFYGETMPHGYVLPPRTTGGPPIARPGQPQFDPALQQQALQQQALQRQGGGPAQVAARADASPAPFVPRQRSASSILVARRADEHIRYALVLAERGAAYSARSELIQVLRLVSQTLDQERGTQVHGWAMVAGLRALREADDFASRNSDPADVVNLAHCIATHRTPVLKGVDTTRITPMDALQEYHTFASQQLALAGGQEPVASMALYGLARLQSVLNVGAGPRRSTAETNAIALHQAALAIDRHNYMAANELAVLLARYGQMQSAQALLQHSLSICESAETWHNLAVLYQDLGASEAARWARHRGQLYVASQSSGHGGSPGSTIYWVDAATLARSSSADEAIGPAMPAAMPAGEQLASPWPQRNATDTAGSDRSPESSGLGRFIEYLWLGEQDATSPGSPPETSQIRSGQTLR